MVCSHYPCAMHQKPFLLVFETKLPRNTLPYKAFLKSCSLMSATSTAVTHKYIFDYWFQAGMKNPRQPADMGKCESCSSAQNNTVVFGLDLGRQALPLELLALRMYRGICFSVQAAKWKSVFTENNWRKVLTMTLLSEISKRNMFASRFAKPPLPTHLVGDVLPHTLKAPV